jgi:hypothetical protein
VLPGCEADELGAAAWDAGAGADAVTAVPPAEMLLAEPPLESWLITTDATTTAPIPARMFRTQWLLLPRRGERCAAG